MSQPDTQVCKLTVKIDGAEEIQATSTEKWSIRDGLHVTSIVVDQRLDAPDTFQVQFMASHEGERTVFDFAKEGASIEIGFGYEQPETVFKGEIIYVESEYSAQGGSFVTLRGYDHSHRLTRGFSAKSFGQGESEDQTLSDLVSDVITNSKTGQGEKSDGLSADQVDSTEFKSRWIPKAMTTNYDFLKWAGSSLGRASGSGQQDKKISFRALNINSSPVAAACMENMDDSGGAKPLRVVSARMQVSTFPSYAKVRIHGWNSKEKKAFVGEVDSCSPEIDAANANSGWKSGWKATGQALYGDEGSGAVFERVMDYCESQEEADKIAQGLFDSFSLRYFTGDVEVMGFPQIVPGAVVELKGFGDRSNGKVLVTEATHSISATSGQPYLTAFKFASNAAKPAG